MKFSELGLSDLILSALDAAGYTSPTPIQAQAIPPVLEGRDVMAAAQTGTGKTAGFTLPILELLSKGEPAEPNTARVLILTPTRELAAQVAASVAEYSANMPLKHAVVFGGVKINPQMMQLRKGVDILVATPGRLLDLYQQNAIRFPRLEILILDEADRMLDMGFIHDIKKLIRFLPTKRQTLMFSATFSNDIRELAKGLMQNPVEISVAPANATADQVEQLVYTAERTQKPRMLMQILRELNIPQVLVFSRTKHGANRLVKQLSQDGFLAAAIHGNKSQGARTKALADFKANQVQVLVATDIAARGLDIEELPHVVNYDLPHVAEDYVHRIGRTGRAGATGEAVSLVAPEDRPLLAAIERLVGRRIEQRTPEGLVAATPQPQASARAPGRAPVEREPRREGGRHHAPRHNGRPQQAGSERKRQDSRPRAADGGRNRRPRRDDRARPQGN